MELTLPFPRGSTATGSNVQIAGPRGLVSQLPSSAGDVTEGSAFRKDLAGCIGQTRDKELSNTSSTTTAATDGVIKTPGTNRLLHLLAVQAGAKIIIDHVGQLIAFDSTAKQFGVVATETSVDGGICRPIDNAYAVGFTIQKYDWFWVVWSGPCYANVATGVTTVAQGPVACEGADGFVTNAAAGDYILGTFDAAVTGDDATLALIYVRGSLEDSDPAG
jgi:hypothetical protein